MTKAIELKLRQHPIYRAIYITPDGRVFQELHATRMGGGYSQVSFRNGTGRLVANRHVLVLEAYKGLRPSSKHETRHMNGNPHDDRSNNLKWGTRKDNVADAMRHGTTNRKLNESSVREIRQKLATGESVGLLAASFQVCRATIYDIKKGKNWKRVTTRGETHYGRRKLTESNVRKIKQRIATGESSKLIAADFQISQQMVCNIKKGRDWNWVT